MTDTASITFRLERTTIRALKIRGVMNDRSANKELSEILKEVLNTKKASDQPASNPDASTTTL